MSFKEAKERLEKSFDQNKNEINDFIKSLKKISSEEVLNGSVAEAQKILSQILPVEEASNKILEGHKKFLSIINKINIKDREEATLPKEDSVSFDDVASKMNELVEEELVEEVAEDVNENADEQITAAQDYRLSILKSLIYLGGSAKIEEIFKFIEKDMKSKFHPADFESIDGGETKRWNENVKLERTAMVEEGLLSADSTNGTWEIVQKGIDYLSNRK